MTRKEFEQLLIRLDPNCKYMFHASGHISLSRICEVVAIHLFCGVWKFDEDAVELQRQLNHIHATSRFDFTD